MSNSAGLLSRQVSFDILDSVIARKNALDVAIAGDARFADLPANDRGFVRMLVTTTLRRMGQIDDIISRLEQKGGASQNLKLQNVLRLGLCQILFMDVSDHAAVDVSVRLAEALGMTRQKGFVNGLLRNVTREGQAILRQQDAGRLNAAEWLLKLWIADYGMRGAAEIAAANMEEPPLDIILKDTSNSAYWNGVLGGHVLAPGIIRREEGGSVISLNGYDKGDWWVQDMASALPARLMGDVRGQSVIDMCAAPGGKTMQLAAMGAHVIALDRSAKRMQRLRENITRVDLADRVEWFIEDAAQWKPREPVSHILLDAPCSATGTMRRHPELALLKKQSDIDSLVAVQERILGHAFDVLAPGGVLIYCTCSLQKSESENQVSNFLAQHKNAQLVPVEAHEAYGIEEAITARGEVRFLPSMMAGRGGLDGFYIARLTKMS